LTSRRIVMSEAPDIEGITPSDAPPDTSTTTTSTEGSSSESSSELLFFVESHRIVLQVPKAMEGYAVRHGALYDQAQKAWYVLGDVPEVLESFGPPPTPRQPVYEFSPPCPHCGSCMVKRYRKRDRDPFWSCSRFPACKGIVEWEPPSPASPAAILNTITTPSTPPQKPPQAGQRLLLRRKWEELTAQLVEKLGSVSAAEAWLFNPHPDLQHITPAKTMLTMDGVSKVEQLIQSLPGQL
jgi:hypothetical protein